MKKLLILGIAGFFLLSSCNDDNLDVKDVGKDNIMGVNNEDIAPRLAEDFYSVIYNSNESI